MCEPLRGKIDELLTNGTCEYLRGINKGTRDSFKSFKSAVEFYKKYRGASPHHIFLQDDCPKVYKLYRQVIKEHSEGKREFITFDDWLFDYCFGDVIE